MSLTWRVRAAAVVLLLVVACFLGTRRQSTQQGPNLLRMTASVYRAPAPQELAEGAIIQAGAKVQVKLRRPPWVHISLGDTDGWLPDWYLTWELTDDIAQDFEPYCMVVKENCPVRLFPHETADEITRLQAGKVVQVRARFQSWHYVRIAVYSIPDVQRGWVQRESLVDLAEGHPMEGKILPGTQAFFGDPQTQSFDSMHKERVTQVFVVYLAEEARGMVHVFGAAGWDAWVSKDDIVFNPFH